MAGLEAKAVGCCYTKFERRLRNTAAHPGRLALFSILAIRVVVFALPFLAYSVWAWIAKRRGRELGSVPWGWLVGSGAVLVGLSLMATVAFEGDNRNKTYVPAEAHSGGAVTPGHFEAR